MQDCLSCCAFKLNICFQLLTWLMGMKWLESQWALSCHHVQNPRDGYVYAVWKCMISFARSGLWRPRWLSLSKFRHPQSEARTGFKSLGSCPCVSRSMGYGKCCAEANSYCPSLAWVLVPKKIWETWNHLLPIISWNILQDTQISDSPETLTLIFMGCKPHFPFLAGKFC